MATLISEFAPNPAGADPALVTIELKGVPGAAFSGFLISLEADSATGNGAADRVAAISGTFDADGILSVEVPDLENPSFTLVLTDDTATVSAGDDLDADNDGVIDDPSVLGTVLDAIGIVDNATDISYAAQLGGTDFPYVGSEPVLMFRDASFGSWYAMDGSDVIYDEAGDIVDPAEFDTLPDSLGSYGATNPSRGAVLLSEFAPNPAGSDPATQTIELSGIAGESFSGFLISLEADSATGNGAADRVVALSGTFDASGILAIDIEDLENPSFTLVLTDALSTVTQGDDLDADNDGVIDDIGVFGNVLDAIGIVDNTTDISYAAQLGGVDFPYIGSEPLLMFRDASTGGWFAVNGSGTIFDETDTEVDPADFDVSPVADGSFGAVNPSLGDGGGPVETVISIAVADGLATEGTADDAITFTITRTGDALGETTVMWAGSGLATALEDYVPGEGVISFAAGETEQTLTLSIIDDALVEGSEDVTITLFGAVGGTIGTASADAVIQDDDAAVTAIYDIQGAGDASALAGAVVTIEAVVVGDFQDGDADASRNLRGFYLQEATGDGDAATSDGIFVYDLDFGVDVNVGDVVRVTGTVAEYFGETQIRDVTAVSVSGTSALPDAAVISLPAAAVTQNQDGDWQPDLEAYEGMLVSIETELTVTELFQLDRFNEMKLSAGGRLEQFTQSNAPDAAGYAAWLEANGARTITYDDGQQLQNLPIGQLDGLADPFASANAVRMGDTITDLSGVLNYQWAGNSASGATWRVISTQDGENTFTPSEDARPVDAPDVGGTLKVASMNVLNYFNTIDLSGVTTDLGHDPRGADSVEEFDRQTQKLVQALATLDADIVALMEIENDFVDDGMSAIETLVTELNLVVGPGTYDWVRPGADYVGGDAIAVAFIYDTTSVQIAAGTTVEMLEDSDLAGLGLDFGHPLFDGDGANRVSLAATFEEIATGETFTAVNNHFKSKGSVSPWGNNADQLDGQGNNNEARVQAATAVDAWIDSDPTGSGDSDFLILGDLNSYAMEDPITLLKSEGYTDLAQDYVGPDAYSYTFDGQTGTLDYALANGSLAAQVTGAAEWHINADEADALDYNLDFGRDAGMFDGTDEFRASDHDPVVVGLNLSSGPNEIAGTGAGSETYEGAAGADLFLSDGGALEMMRGNGGEDYFDFTAWQSNGTRDIARILDYGPDDVIDLGGAALAMVRERGNTVTLVLEGENDTLIVSGVSSFEEIVFAEFLLT